MTINKPPTPQELVNVCVEYTDTLNHLQELGLVIIQSDAGAKLNPNLNVELIGQTSDNN
jgi:hypothetical protein